jgi:multimeric flavodoxin WrbA
VSKTFRLLELCREELERAAIQPDVLDLSLLTSDYGRKIHPCKGCASTAMPLCHRPCSCYPNHALNQTNDWMAEIQERWTAAHAVLIVSPVYWYQSPSPLKLMIDRLVCADGGDPDPTSTSGKKAGIDSSRRELSDRLDGMGCIDAGAQARLGRYIGCFEPYANSHEASVAQVSMTWSSPSL